MILPSGRKRKICVVSTSRADYGRMKPVMEAIRQHSALQLQVVAGTPLFFDHLLWYFRHGEPASFLKSLPWYIRARRAAWLRSDGEIQQLEALMKLLSSDGFPISARLPMFLEGGKPRSMAKTAAFGLLGAPAVLEKLEPDIVLLHGDRFEILSMAVAASFMNIPLAHIEGGDVSGTIDNSVRHAVTKLAHIHFPVTEKSRDRLIRMGEHPDTVFLSGSPIIDFLKSADLTLDNRLYETTGKGIGSVLKKRNIRVDLTKPFLFVLYHPVTTEYGKNYKNMKALIAAVDMVRQPTVFVAPNIDAGMDGVTMAIREYLNTWPPHAVFFRGFAPEDFCRVLAHASVAIGNSSSFLREGGYLGVPVVLAGSRQESRERGDNVTAVGCDTEEIRVAIERQRAHGKYPTTQIFGSGDAAQKIVKTLSHINLAALPLQKRFYDPDQNIL